jgi:glutathione S-transferase
MAFAPDHRGVLGQRVAGRDPRRLAGLAPFYNAKDETALAAQAALLHARLGHIEGALRNGPWFAGQRFSLVDAVFSPVFRYFDVFETLADFRFFDRLHKTTQWRNALAERASVREAVRSDYSELLRNFLLGRGSALSRVIGKID